MTPKFILLMPYLFPYPQIRANIGIILSSCLSTAGHTVHITGCFHPLSCAPKVQAVVKKEKNYKLIQSNLVKYPSRGLEKTKGVYGSNLYIPSNAQASNRVFCKFSSKQKRSRFSLKWSILNFVPLPQQSSLSCSLSL